MRLSCAVLGHSTQAYYACTAASISQPDLEDAYLTNALIDAHGDDPEFVIRPLFTADVRSWPLLGARLGLRRYGGQ